MGQFSVTILFDAGSVLSDIQQSATLLVAFGDLVNLANGEKAWGQHIGNKNGMDVISFMANRGNWYPQSSMIELISIIKGVVGEYDEVICYGGSMGGYAAIKYAKNLGARYAIAMAPQFSIDPEKFYDYRFSRYYVGSLNAEMEILQSEIPENLLIISDPDYAADERHVRSILSLAPDARRINVRNVDHHVTSTLAGSDFFMGVIGYARGVVSFGAFSALIRSKRRVGREWVKVLITKLVNRHPAYLAHLIRTLPEVPQGMTDLIRFMLHRQMMRSDKTWQSASKVILPAIRHRLGLPDLGENEFYICSHLGGLLCRSDQGGLRCIPVMSSLGVAQPIVARKVDGDIVCDDLPGVEISRMQDGITLMRDGLFLTAQKTAPAAFRAKNVKQWEVLLFL